MAKAAVFCCALLWALLAAAGCAPHSVTAAEAGGIMQQALCDKYGETFTVGEVVPTAGSGPFNDNPGYQATAARTADGGEFTVCYSSRTAAVTDNYAKVLYGAAMLDALEASLRDCGAVTVDGTGVFCPLTQACWYGEADYPDYLAHSGAYVWAYLTATDPDALPDALYAVCQALESRRLYYALTVSVGQQTVCLTRDADSGPLTAEDLAARF